MAKKRKNLAAKKKIAVKEVVLSKTGVVRVVAPPGVIPLVRATDKAIEIVPVKKAHAAKQGWWSYLFGN